MAQLQQQYGRSCGHGLAACRSTSSYDEEVFYQYPSIPPPGADPELWQYFTTVDVDRSGQITVKELRLCSSLEPDHTGRVDDLMAVWFYRKRFKEWTLGRLRP